MKIVTISGPVRESKQSGFSIVELMVALTLGIILMTGVLQLYVQTSTSNNELAKTNALIENGRLTIQLLQTDIAHAGFWDGYVPQFDDLTYESGAPTDVPTAVPDPCLDFASWDAAYRDNVLGIPIQVYDDIPGTCAGIIADRQADTDILVVRHADTTSCQPDVASDCEADRLYFQPSLCNAFSSYTYSLVNDTALMTQTQRDCASIAPARKYVSNIYYVRDYAVTAGDGIPTLVRSSFDVDAAGDPAQVTPEALIEGVESLKIELGTDEVSDSGDLVDYTTEIAWSDTSNKISPTNRGDGAPDGNFIRCTTASPCTVSNLINVVSVKVYVLARNRGTTAGHTDTKEYTLGSTAAAVGPFNDNYKRHVYTSTVRLTNVSARRETP